MKRTERGGGKRAPTQAGVALDNGDCPLEAAAAGRSCVIAVFSRFFGARLRALEGDKSTHTFALGT